MYPDAHALWGGVHVCACVEYTCVSVCIHACMFTYTDTEKHTFTYNYTMKPSNHGVSSSFSE